MNAFKKKYKAWQINRHVKKFGSKNNGYFNCFNSQWFIRHQHILLFLLNHWLLKYWSRWILRIHNDLKFSETIDLILPNTYRVKIGANRYRSDFRTHNKFSKRIYYAFSLVWWTMHIMDFALDKIGRMYDGKTWKPYFSFGFATLTAYPDAHTEVSTVDGIVYYAPGSMAFSTLRSGTSGTAVDNGASINAILASSNTTNEFSSMHRGFMLFNTSSLTGATGVSAILSGYYYGKTNTLAEMDAHIAASSPASNTAIVDADFDNVSFTSFGSITYANFTASQYNEITLNASGISNINLSGISKFSFLSNWDVNNSFNATWKAQSGAYIQICSADTTGTANDPKLVVTYTPAPSTGQQQQMMI